MSRGSINFFEAAAAAALVLYPPIGAGLLFVRGVLVCRRRPSLIWLLPWSSLLLLGLFVLLHSSSYQLLLQAVFGALAGFFLLVLRRRHFLAGLMVGLAIIVLVGFAERERSRALWIDAGTPQSNSGLIAGISKLSGDNPGWKRNGIRLFEKQWALAPDTQKLEFSLEMRSRKSESGWQWLTNSPKTQQMRHVESGNSFTRITGLEASIVRRARMPAPLGGASVRASLELRASAPTSRKDCALQLRTFEPSLSACEPLHLDSTWQSFAIEYDFPQDATNTTFEVAIAALGVDYLDIRNLDVAVLEDGIWIPAGPLEPEGVQIRFPLPGVHNFSQPSLIVVPTPEWQRFSLNIESGALASMSTITGLLQLEAGNAVEIKNIDLRTSTPGQREPIPKPRQRSSLWFEQANLPGHSFATLGLLGLILAPLPLSIITLFLVLLLTMGAVFITGSRTAWLATFLGGSWLLWLHSRPWQRAVLVILVIAAAAMIAMTGGYKALGRLQPGNLADGNSVTRVEIWSVAWNGLRDQPLTGNGPNGYAHKWRELHPTDTRVPPSHAHNLWLEFAVSYGLPGFAAILWLTGSLTWLAWRQGGWRGLALVIPVMLMNVFDYTLFSSGVLFPLILGINALRAPPRRLG